MSCGHIVDIVGWYSRYSGYIYTPVDPGHDPRLPGPGAGCLLHHELHGEQPRYLVSRVVLLREGLE